MNASQKLREDFNMNARESEEKKHIELGRHNESMHY